MKENHDGRGPWLLLSDFRRLGDNRLTVMQDSELLQRYASDRSESAFAELVRRHIDLVHSAARRQVQSSQLAEDVAQSVFLELARQANQVKAEQSLAAWLYVVTRRKAIDALRRESRRRKREHDAWEVSAMKTTSSAWVELEPFLDEAIAGLDRADQRAVFLRFFESRSFREIGEVIGISEDTAQKRVSRALERLRAFFAKRGMTATAAGLAAELATHAVEAAPPGLAISITHIVGSSTAVAAHAAAFSSVKSLAMTFTQKFALTTMIVAAIGGTLYLARAIEAERADIARFSRELATLDRTNQALAAEISRSRLAEAAGLRNRSDTTLSEAEIVSRAIGRVKKRIADHPEAGIFEFRYLTPEDWILAVEGRGKIESDRDYRHVLAALREDASGGVNVG